jgi:SH3-like domain-containing protein
MRAGFDRPGWAGLAAVLRGLAPAGLAALLGLSLPTPAAAAQELGTVSKLPIPRYVSLKTDRVNLREGPSKDHRTTWVFQRAGLPVEIVAEFETWRRIRDAEGTEGWVLHSLLSGRRTSLVMPWAKGDAKGDAPPIPLLARADERADPVARLQPNVIVNVRACSGSWCRVTVVLPGARDIEGFVRQDRLWGVYPDERIE